MKGTGLKQPVVNVYMLRVDLCIFLGFCANNFALMQPVDLIKGLEIKVTDKQ